MKWVICIFTVLVSLRAGAQIEVSGLVIDEVGGPVSFASVYLEETFEGTSTQLDGTYLFSAKEAGQYTLVASAVGFKTTKKFVDLDSAPLKFTLSLDPDDKVLGGVVITAGAFSAGVEAKSAMLKPLDIVTNPASQGDIYQALETLPGVSQVEDQTGMFVRGGDAHETKTIIDGVLVSKPFFGETPNMASRSRFDPFMFKGTTFTTGGYSAEYGGALSSILLLNTSDMPTGTSSSIGLNMAGVSFAHQHVWNERTAMMADFGYTNLNLLFNSVPLNTDWIKVPEGFGTNWGFRQKTQNGMIKSYFQFQQGDLGIKMPDVEGNSSPFNFTNFNQSVYWNSSYHGQLSEKLFLYTGFALNYNREDMTYDSLDIYDQFRLYHAKTTLYYDFSEGNSLKFGIESFGETESEEVMVEQKVRDQYTAAYVESDISLGKRWAVRIGARAEYSAYLNDYNLAPRTSLAYKTGKNSQISLASGLFYQKPENEYLMSSDAVGFEQSTHLIANYQWMADDRSFRIEIYDKEYDNLFKWHDAEGSNSGNGYSRGIDLFWKDDRSIRNLDYWISYSYIDAKRDYLDFPEEATPSFVTDHTLSLVANYSLEHLGLSPGFAYTYASGRRYVNPNSDDYLSDRTNDYHVMNFNLSYITEIFGNFAVIYGALENPFGIERIYGYEYSSNAEHRRAIKPNADTTFFLGVFVNFRK